MNEDKILKILEPFKEKLSIDHFWLLKVLLESETYFMPFSFNSKWDYVYGIGKVELIKYLTNKEWYVEYGETSLEDDIKFIYIRFNGNRKKKDLLSMYVDATDEDLNFFSALEIYITYSDYLKIFKKVTNYQ